MSGWQPIETAPRDGTMIIATHNRCGKWWPEYKTFWGVGARHAVKDDRGDTIEGYVVNGGKPWWISEHGDKLAPTPTFWKPLSEHEGGE